jgi:signal transduction histidine kinase
VRRNVEAMGGTIEAENRAPHGLAVHVRLPLAPSRGGE